MKLDTKDYIIISLCVVLFVILTVITYLVFGRRQMNNRTPPVETRQDYYNNRLHPFLFNRNFSEMGQEAVGQESCIGEMPVGSHIIYNGKNYKLLSHIDGTVDNPDGKFMSRVVPGNKVVYIDPTDNATYLGENPP